MCEKAMQRVLSGSCELERSTLCLPAPPPSHRPPSPTPTALAPQQLAGPVRPLVSALCAGGSAVGERHRVPTVSLSVWGGGEGPAAGGQTLSSVSASVLAACEPGKGGELPPVLTPAGGVQGGG